MSFRYNDGMCPSNATRRRSPYDCGLYVHFPYCETKCGYCDFYSLAQDGKDPAPLLQHMVREMHTRVGNSNHRVRTVFFGGGTPTVLSADQLGGFLTAVGEIVDLSSVEEFTVEANPATIDHAKARLLIPAGVTRVSMGAQSFFANELATLERLHTSDDIPPTIRVLRDHGINHINLDLMFGIPGQTLDTWAQSLQRAVDLGTDHLSCYGLTYEPGTPLTTSLRHGRITPCDEQLEADMYELAINALAAAGFEQYELSNFSKPHRECRHNLSYWRNEPYIGVGPSAVGCLNGRRYKNVPDVFRYVGMMTARGDAEAESEDVDRRMLMTEMIMMQMRLNEGLSKADFRERIGCDPDELFGRHILDLENLGMLASLDGHIALTRKGRLVANAVIAQLSAAGDERLRHAQSCPPHPDSNEDS